MTTTAPLTAHPSTTWRPGEVHLIPRLYGPAQYCTITRVNERFVNFIGPWGPGMISHELLNNIVQGATPDHLADPSAQ